MPKYEIALATALSAEEIAKLGTNLSLVSQTVQEAWDEASMLYGSIGNVQEYQEKFKALTSRFFAKVLGVSPDSGQ